MNPTAQVHLGTCKSIPGQNSSRSVLNGALVEQTAAVQGSSQYETWIRSATRGLKALLSDLGSFSQGGGSDAREHSDKCALGDVHKVNVDSFYHVLYTFYACTGSLTILCAAFQTHQIIVSPNSNLSFANRCNGISQQVASRTAIRQAMMISGVLTSTKLLLL